MGVKLTDDLRKAIKAQLTAKPKPGISTRKIIRRDPWAGGFKSDALGVAPEQIVEAQAELARQGVSCEFDARTGAAIMTSQEHYRRVCRAIGLYSGRDGYGVPGSEEGSQVLTGRDREKAKAEFRRKLLEE